jgi:hypothetical protein
MNERERNPAESTVTADEIKAVMFNDVHCLNFMLEQRNRCFQLTGKYDGAMSEESKSRFEKSFLLWDRMLEERDRLLGRKKWHTDDHRANRE